jgi:hypothetical protein
MFMRALVLPVLAVALFACGGTEATSSVTGTEPLVGDNAPPFAATPPPQSTPPPACELCEATTDCGPDAVCVAFTRGSFCASECTKDGFCPAGQTCGQVPSESGAYRRACVRDDGACGQPRQPRVGAMTPSRIQ